MSFQHCEADTIMFSIYLSLRSSGNNQPVIINFEDTDVYVMAATLSHLIPGKLCVKKKKHILYDTMCPDQLPNPFHVMTG